MNNTEINLETFADNINSADIENKNYKDSVFRMLFSDKAELLTLYNAINGSNYTNVDDLEINTLDKGVFLKMRNDVSFIFNFELNLYEHQSTVCGNMPIRDFLYAAEKIHSMLKGKDLHSRVMLKIPTPRFVVFYNGENDLPDVSTQKLSDHFEKIVESPELELVVTTLNININRNKKLMEGCKTLKEYSLFVNKVRYYINEYKVTDSEDKKVMIAKAVSAAIDDCISENILYDFLTEYRKEVQDMCTVEYYEQLHNDSTRQEGFDEGYNTSQKEIITNALDNGRTPEQISDFTGIDLKIVQEVADKHINENS